MWLKYRNCGIHILIAIGTQSLQFQHFTHMSDCSVQWANRTRNTETTVHTRTYIQYVNIRDPTGQILYILTYVYTYVCCTSWPCSARILSHASSHLEELRVKASKTGWFVKVPAVLHSRSTRRLRCSYTNVHTYVSLPLQVYLSL